ncbi:hypothetical protein EW145_g3387 [Phellinidium pouzarii]|uniref:Uncharacterized protein n=1 Tax=Phellinidium pouzarii TaxID=167371 RepID=A0A4S4L7H1_9AGAM|nr:hypothetical protein EW145_g3387 [Phellinidium pouzarii]
MARMESDRGLRSPSHPRLESATQETTPGSADSEQAGCSWVSLPLIVSLHVITSTFTLDWATRRSHGATPARLLSSHILVPSCRFGHYKRVAQHSLSFVPPPRTTPLSLCRPLRMFVSPARPVDQCANAYKRKQPMHFDVSDCEEDPASRPKRRLFLTSDIKPSSICPALPSSSPAQSVLPSQTSQLFVYSNTGLREDAYSSSDEEDELLSDSECATEIRPNGYRLGSIPLSPFSTRTGEKERDRSEEMSRELGSLVESVKISAANETLSVVRKHSPGILPPLESPKIPAIFVKRSSPSTNPITDYCSVRLAGRAMLADQDQSRRARSVPVEVPFPVLHRHIPPNRTSNGSGLKAEFDPVHTQFAAPRPKGKSPQRMRAHSIRQEQYFTALNVRRAHVVVHSPETSCESESQFAREVKEPVVVHPRLKPEADRSAEQARIEISPPVRHRSLPSINDSSAGHQRASSSSTEHMQSLPVCFVAHLNAQADDVNSDEQPQLESANDPVGARSRSGSESSHPPLPIGLEHWINLGDSYFQCPRDKAILRGHRSAVRHEERDLNIRATCEYCGQHLARRDAVLRHQKSTCKKAPKVSLLST